MQHMLNLFLGQQSSTTQTYVRKLLPVIFVKHKWQSGCAKKKRFIWPSH